MKAQGGRGERCSQDSKDNRDRDQRAMGEGCPLSFRPTPGCPELGVALLLVLLLLLDWTVGISVKSLQLRAPQKAGAWRAARHPWPGTGQNGLLPAPWPSLRHPSLGAGHASPSAEHSAPQRKCLAASPKSSPTGVLRVRGPLPSRAPGRTPPARDRRSLQHHTQRKKGRAPWLDSKGKKTRNSWLSPKTHRGWRQIAILESLAAGVFICPVNSCVVRKDYRGQQSSRLRSGGEGDGMGMGMLWEQGRAKAPPLATAPSGTPPTAQQRHRVPVAHTAR